MRNSKIRNAYIHKNADYYVITKEDIDILKKVTALVGVSSFYKDAKLVTMLDDVIGNALAKSGDELVGYQAIRKLYPIHIKMRKSDDYVLCNRSGVASILAGSDVTIDMNLTCPECIDEVNEEYIQLRNWVFKMERPGYIGWSK